MAGTVVGVLLLATLAGCGSSTKGTGESSATTPDSQSAEQLLGPANAASGDPVLVGLVSDGATQSFDNTDELRAGEATAEYWNAHKAGIGGRPIQVVTCETGGTPAGATTCANQMIEKDVVAVTLSQSVVTDQVWQALHTAGVPTWLTQASGTDIESDTASTFLVFNPQATFFGLPVAAAKEAGVQKITFVVIDVPQAVDIIQNGGGQLLKDAGYDYDLVRVPIGTADMTSQMVQVVNSGAGVVQVIGNDAFCIAAFQGLKAASYTGSITAVSQCVTDATRKAMPGGLEGINVLSTLALGATDDPTFQLYQAVMSTYGSSVKDVNNLTSMGGYAAIGSLATALGQIPAGGDITRQSVLAAIRAMPKSTYPGGGGITYQCDSKALPTSPPVCTNDWLRAKLDANGNTTSYSVENSSDLFH